MRLAKRWHRQATYWLLAALAAHSAQSWAQGSVPLPAETSDVATLAPPGPHRVFVMAGFESPPGVSVIDADSDDLKMLGMVPLAQNGFMALSNDAERIFVIETFYSRGNRGAREDVLGIYDGRTLDLEKEIVLPGRLQVVPKPGIFDVSEDARLAYVYDMLPASAVHVIDLEAGKLQTSVELPGCALAFPYGPRGFASICGDGTLGLVQVPESGEAQVTFSKPFFETDADPLFESGVVDKTRAQGWLLSFTGKLFPVRFGASPLVGKPWSLTEAAGLPRAGTGVQELAWRPGGAGRMLALHDSSSRLYVLMHAGNHWTHKQAGSEVWVLDAARQKLIRRITLESPAQSIAVSQDAAALLYVMGKEGEFSVLDATSGEVLRKRSIPGMFAWVPGN